MKTLYFMISLLLVAGNVSAQLYIGINGKMSHTNFHYDKDNYWYVYYVKNLRNLPSMSLNVKKIVSYPIFLDIEIETIRMKFKHYRGVA